MEINKKQILFEEIQNVPDFVLDQVIHFVCDLKGKLGSVNETSLLSEESLAKDWSKQEEDLAWENL